MRRERDDTWWTKGTILRSKIYQQRGDCFFCEKTMVPINDVKGHHPLNPTMEHLQPLSRGGKHTIENSAAACYLCNHTKGPMNESEFREWITRGRPNKAAYMRSLGLDSVTTPSLRERQHEMLQWLESLGHQVSYF